MIKISRRQLSHYAVEQLQIGVAPRTVARLIVAELAASNRLGQADQLVSDIYYELERRKLVAVTTLTSATRLDDILKNDVKKLIKKVTGVDKTIVLDELDDSLIGGIAVSTATYSFDMTIKKTLEDLRQEISADGKI